ncbi:putative small GTP-binding protein RAB6 [Trypanosoma rangeli]|uniref:Putative small GTP-binding protein RAB6 n=1 Tax=Trypanosoma rangeli TaxID=5698 RepID=A0A3R7LYA6_TRYRA|nr:putative small GTP-binding protein RAB6 [Trypanosoma rangeli]RNE95970.1 putative small GTP-binding protein RAB6 [Trypanosoma rangeli]|eukprot:RNE95970.1 putative small GTP-binding protein RAB6 [Trypanosoma rangeli]
MPDIPIVVLGGGGVGKSCLTIQYIQGHFVDKYDATIEDVYRKPIDLDNQPAVLTIVDTAGQDAFGAMRDQYLRKGQGFVLVYSITDAESFQQLKRIYAQLCRVKGGKSVPCVVVGNKIDEVNYRAVSPEEGSLFAAQAQCPFLEVTAKNRRMAEEVFETLVHTIRNGGNASEQKHANGAGGTFRTDARQSGTGLHASDNAGLHLVAPSALSPPSYPKKKKSMRSAVSAAALLSLPPLMR